ncbi:hypothetical protein [Brucella cytisi]|uniref:Uncharacterized protein n=1 Tax=Brucella cytisi TaxID=407152 RepID=A0A1J6HRT1_9HYPH|nr:hypothetical protein [Brucella cytisi]OIS95113.1 hypothetical protein BLA27_03790 [Brucella cytisi]
MKKREGPVAVDIFGFLSTETNAVLKPIQPRAMTVVFRTTEELHICLHATWDGMPKHPPNVDLIDLMPGNGNKARRTRKQDCFERQLKAPVTTTYLRFRLRETAMSNRSRTMSAPYA